MDSQPRGCPKPTAVSSLQALADATLTPLMMQVSGVDRVVIDDGDTAAQVEDAKFDKVPELVGNLTFPRLDP